MHFWPRNSKQADIMVVLLLSRYVDNHGHLWSRDFKLTNECVYSSFLLKLLHQIGNTPTQQLEILRTWLNQREPSSNQPGSTGRYLDPVGNKGFHSIYFFILKQHKPKCNLPAKIKGCEDPSAATYAKTNNLAPTKAVKSIENTSTQLRDPRRKYPDFAFLHKNKGCHISLGIKTTYKI